MELDTLPSSIKSTQPTPADSIIGPHGSAESQPFLSRTTSSQAASVTPKPLKTPRSTIQIPSSRVSAKDVNLFRAFLRSVGLKFLASYGRGGKFVIPRFTLRIFRNAPYTGELPKVIVDGKRSIALVRAGVHILPFVITLFLVLFNGNKLLNGPQISGTAIFALQVAAKLHELAIVGSLTSIALDLIRYHQLNHGVNLGLLASGLSMASPSWLLSSDLVSGIKSCFKVRPNPRKLSKKESLQLLLPTIVQSKTFLLILLVTFTILATIVGPASALLFTPTQLWVESASTHFYIAGVDEDLWPMTLTKNHTGSEACDMSPLRMDIYTCLYASWRALLGAVTILHLIRPGFQYHTIGERSYQFPPARLINGNIPIPESNFNVGDPDTWAVSPHLAVASHLKFLGHHVESSFGYAKGRRKRIRDFGGSHLVVATDGKIPVTRTVCSLPVTVSAGASSMMNIPNLKEDKYWHKKIPLGQGDVMRQSLESLGLKDWDALQPNTTSTAQARATWLPLPKGHGAGSALMVNLVQNRTYTWAYTCVVDARWATGQTMHSDRSVMWSWEAQPGVQHFDRRTSSADWAFDRVGMFHERYAPHYSKPVQVEQPWLDALAPSMPEASMPGNTLVMNAFEALLNQSGLLKADAVPKDALGDNALMIEYATTLYFLNALSRIGLIHQLEPNNPTSTTMDPALIPYQVKDDTFIGGGTEQYDARDPFAPFSRGFYQQFKYGTAWSFNDMGQYLSLSILCVHLVVAVIHTIVLCWTKRSSEAWDSITELVVLAYRSTARPGSFENCSSGIRESRTLEKEVRIGTRVLGDGSEKAELVVCGEEDGVGDVVSGKAYG